MATREEGEIEIAKSGSFFFADVCLSARTTLLHNRTTLAVCPGENSLAKYVPMLYFNLILFLGTCQTLTLQCVILGLQFSLTNINVSFQKKKSLNLFCYLQLKCLKKHADIASPTVKR